jgi:hypothetical protein
LELGDEGPEGLLGNQVEGQAPDAVGSHIRLVDDWES